MDSIAGRRRSTRYLVPLADLFNQENGEENMNTQALQAPPKQPEIQPQEALPKFAKKPLDPAARASYNAKVTHRGSVKPTFGSGQGSVILDDKYKGLFSSLASPTQQSPASQTPVQPKQFAGVFASSTPDKNGAETPFKFKVTIGPNRREVVPAAPVETITPRKDYLPIAMPQLTPQVQKAPESVASRKREPVAYEESPAKRRRISLGTRTSRRTIIATALPPLATVHASISREIPTAESLFSSPRSRSNSESASSPIAMLPPAQKTAVVVNKHLVVPESKDSEVALTIEEIAAFVIFGQDDRNVITTFLLAYPHFKTTAKDLFKMVWAFYHQPPLQYWKLISTFASQRARVVNFVTFWASLQPNDFDLSPPAPVTPGVPPPKEKSNKIPLKFYLKFLEALKSDGSDVDELDLSSQGPLSGLETPSKPTHPASPRRSISKRVSRFGTRRQSSIKGNDATSFMNFEPEHFALQLTLFEFRLLKNIPLNELIGQAWNKTDKEINAPRITNAINHFNRMSFWVSQEIQQAESTKEQKARIERFILLGKHLKNMGNFNALMEIISGLNENTVQRLSDAWKAVSTKDKARLAKFEALMSPFQNAGSYRTCLAEFKKTPMMPYLGVHLADIVHLLEGVADEIPDHYSLQKVLNLGHMLRGWQDWQKQHCDIVEDFNVFQFILTLRASVSLSGPQAVKS